MAPILLGLAVMCWRVRQRWLSRANPRSPRQRRERRMALRVRLLTSSSRPPGGCLTGIRTPMPAPFISGVGQRGQVMRSGTVESGQGVRAGGGEVVYRAGLGGRDPQREPVRGEDGVDVAAVGVRLAGVP